MVTCENIRVKSDNIYLSGAIFKPAGYKNLNNQSVIICHGMPSGTYNRIGSDEPIKDDGISYRDLAEWFALEGLITVIFNFRGTGESGGNFHHMGWVKDLNAVIDWLLKDGCIDSNKVCLLGSSLGAAVAIYVAAHRKEISAVISFASPSTMSVLKTPELSLNRYRQMGIIRDSGFPMSVKDWASEPSILNPREWVGDIPPRPLLLLHGSEDDVVDPKAMEVLQEYSGHKAQCVLISGAGHRLRSEPEIVKISIEWLKNLFI